MSGLTPHAQELVRAGREALRPSAADRERVSLALAPKLGAGLAGAGTSALSTTSVAAKATTLKLVAGLVGFGLVGGAVVLGLRSEAPPPTTPPPVSAVSPLAPTPTATPGEPSPAVSTTLVPAVASPEEAPRGAALAAPPAPSTGKPDVALGPAESLAQEVAILSRAGADLHAGRPAAALVALAEHQRKFPRGALTQERTAARVQALCALGRKQEAQSELDRLARVSPNSPLEARSRQACNPPTK